MENLLFSINATLPIFLLMVLGYTFARTGLVSRDFAKNMNTFVFKVALPAEMFVDMASMDIRSAWDGKFVLFCFVVTLLSIGLASLISRLLIRRDRSERGEFIQAAFRSSAAILGVAFIQNIYGEGNTMMAALMMIGSVPLYNIFSVIVLMLTAGEGTSSKLMKKILTGIITNPILLGILFGIFWSLLRLPLPQIPGKVLSDVGKMATPMGLIAMGAMFEPAAMKKKVKPALTAAVMKLCVWEVLFLPLAVLLGFRGQQLVALTVMLGSASTVACYVMATGMGHKGTLTSGTVMITTAGCSFTLTLCIYILRSLGLI